MNMRYARRLVTHFPALQDMRFATERYVRRLLRRPFESDFRLLSQIELGPGEQALDIGANRGQSIDAIRLYWGSVKIVAFEPNKHLARRLMSLFASDPNIVINPVGLGGEAGAFNLFIPVYQNYVFDGLASFDRAQAANWLSAATIAGYRAEHVSVRELDCEVARLDDFNLQPGFIKIDVQGRERDVIRGGLRTILAHEPIVLMENNHPESDAADLLKNGWKPFSMINEKLVPERYGALNTFYMSEARAAATRIARS